MPSAILGSAKCTNEDNFVLMKFARAVIGTNNVDHCARLCHSSTVGGLAAAFGSGAMTNSIDEIKDARVIFVIGSNTTEQHPMIGMHMLEAKDRGAIIIVADPRRTQIAQFSHLHMRHKSGTDVALLNAMMNVIITEGLVDVSFIRQRTENFDDFEKRVLTYTARGRRTHHLGPGRAISARPRGSTPRKNAPCSSTPWASPSTSPAWTTCAPAPTS